MTNQQVITLKVNIIIFHNCVLWICLKLKPLRMCKREKRKGLNFTVGWISYYFLSLQIQNQASELNKHHLWCTSVILRYPISALERRAGEAAARAFCWVSDKLRRLLELYSTVMQEPLWFTKLKDYTVYTICWMLWNP